MHDQTVRAGSKVRIATTMQVMTRRQLHKYLNPGETVCFFGSHCRNAEHFRGAGNAFSQESNGLRAAIDASCAQPVTPFSSMACALY